MWNGDRPSKWRMPTKKNGNTGLVNTFNGTLFHGRISSLQMKQRLIWMVQMVHSTIGTIYETNRRYSLGGSVGAVRSWSGGRFLIKDRLVSRWLKAAWTRNSTAPSFNTSFFRMRTTCSEKFGHSSRTIGPCTRLGIPKSSWRAPTLTFSTEQRSPQTWTLLRTCEGSWLVRFTPRVSNSRTSTSWRKQSGRRGMTSLWRTFVLYTSLSPTGWSLLSRRKSALWVIENTRSAEQKTCYDIS